MWRNRRWGDWPAIGAPRPRPSRRARWGLSTLAAFVLGFAAQPASAVTPGELVGPALEPEAVTIVSLHNGELSYFGPDRALRQSPLASLVRLRVLGEAETPPEPGPAVLELVDGQRLPGRWVPEASVDGQLAWAHAELGVARVPLERVAGWWAAALDAGSDGGPDPGAGQDVVVLQNGDRLTGFVSEVQPLGVSVIPTGGTDPTTIPGDRVAAVRLANPPAPPAGTRHAVEFIGGARLLVRDLAIASDRVSFTSALLSAGPTAGPAAVDLPLARVTRIDFVGGGYRLEPLSPAMIQRTTGGTVFGLVIDPVFEGSDLLLHAPVVVELGLPAGSVRLAAWAELARDPAVPEPAWAWADFELILTHTPGTGPAPGDARGTTDAAADAGPEPLRVRLRAGQDPIRINTPLNGDRLRIELDPGLNGPVLDRLRLRQPWLLIQSDPAEPSDHPTDP